jgi:hypothetical protein
VALICKAHGELLPDPAFGKFIGFILRISDQPAKT